MPAKGKSVRRSPPRELLVVRHGKSAWDTNARTDFDRPLAKRGKKDAPRMGRWLESEGLVPDLVISSPARRAKQTAERILEEMGLGEEVVRWDPGLYGHGLDVLLGILAAVPRTARRVMLVGHNPVLEDLVLHLGGDAVKIPDDGKLLPTAAVALLQMPPDWGRLPTGAGVLVSITRPKQLPKE